MILSDILCIAVIFIWLWAVYEKGRADQAQQDAELMCSDAEQGEEPSDG